MLQLYKNIKDRRLELGLTQTDLAKAIGYSDKSMIAKIENGTVDLPQSKIMEFAKALSIPAPDLMGWEECSSEVLNMDADMEEICSIMDGLNDEGREKMVAYARDLADTGKYKKHNPIGMGKEA